MKTTTIAVSLSFAPMAARRRRAHVTQARLAQAIGVTPSAICHYENDRRTPSSETLVALAVTLGIPMHELFKSTVTETDAEIRPRTPGERSSGASDHSNPAESTTATESTPQSQGATP